MKILAFCDVDKGILKDAAGHTYIDDDDYSVDDILEDFDNEFNWLNQSGVNLDGFTEFDSYEEDEEYQHTYLDMDLDMCQAEKLHLTKCYVKRD